MCQEQIIEILRKNKGQWLEFRQIRIQCMNLSEVSVRNNINRVIGFFGIESSRKTNEVTHQKICLYRMKDD